MYSTKDISPKERALLVMGVMRAFSHDPGEYSPTENREKHNRWVEEHQDLLDKITDYTLRTCSDRFEFIKKVGVVAGKFAKDPEINFQYSNKPKFTTA